MSSFVNDCITTLIKNSTFRGSIQLLLMEIRHNKARFVREKCMEYVSLILGSWELSDKYVDILADAVKIGLQDGGVRTREVSKIAYLNLFHNWPKKSEKLKQGLPVAIQPRLVKAEEEHLKSVASMLESDEEVHIHDRDMVFVKKDRRMSVQVKRKSIQDEAITAIQALVRGSLTRRKSMVGGEDILASPDKSPAGSLTKSSNAMHHHLDTIDEAEVAPSPTALDDAKARFGFPSSPLQHTKPPFSSTIAPVKTEVKPAPAQKGLLKSISKTPMVLGKKLAAQVHPPEKEKEPAVTAKR
jgi:hypothetical protein